MAAQDDLVIREAQARCVLAAVTCRAELHEAVGILAVWGNCSPARARTALDERCPPGGVRAEASRISAITNAAADSDVDPDWW